MKTGEKRPPVIVWCNGEEVFGFECRIKGPCRLVGDLEKIFQGSTVTHVWIETESCVELDIKENVTQIFF